MNGPYGMMRGSRQTPSFQSATNMWGVKNWPKPKGPSGAAWGLGFLVTLICIPCTSCGVAGPPAAAGSAFRPGKCRQRNS